VGTLADHFNVEDVMCKCGCQLSPIIVPQFVEIVENIRDLSGWPMVIHRWWSCPKHDEDLRKERGQLGNGRHVLGLAIDFHFVQSTMSLSQEEERLRELLEHDQFSLTDDLSIRYALGVGDGWYHIAVENLPRDEKNPPLISWRYASRTDATRHTP